VSMHRTTRFLPSPRPASGPVRGTLALLGAALMLAACGPAPSEPGAGPEAGRDADAARTQAPAVGSRSTDIRAEAIATHVRTLASDAFDGRQPGTPGERLTVDYLVDAFRAAGLAPGNQGRWTQSVPYVQITPSGTPTLRIHGESEMFEPAIPEQFVIGSRTGREVVEVADAPLLFAGYGVVAPEQDWDDYAGIDAEGAAVVVLVNDPGFGSGEDNRFKGREMTYYGRWTYKYEECARQRAAACLIVHEDVAAGYGFNVVQTSFGQRAQFELDRGADAPDKTPVVGWLSTDAARDLFGRAGQDFDALAASAAQPGFQAVALGDLQLDARVESVVERGESDNVLAVLPGRSRPDEWVLVSAHWDHLGSVENPDGGRDIYNGAIDNALGLAAMLEIARALQAGGGTERSVMFLAVTLEESGLIGSRHYVDNPVQPLRQAVANVNIDALLPVPATRDVWIIGKGQSELDDIVREQAASLDRVVAPNPEVEKGFYYRSDQFAFAQAGVPGLFMGPGTDAVEGGREVGEAALAATQGRYHTPADEFGEDWVFDGIVADTQLHYRVVRALADGRQWPRWRQDSEFHAAGEALGR